MQRADIPTRFPIPFANAAVPPYVHVVPEASQIGVTPGAASLTDGFPPANFTMVSAGGIPPLGDDMNGILKQTTQQSRWDQAGAPAIYNSSFAGSIGGYPKGTLLSSELYDGYLWLCTADDTATDPDGGTPDVPLAGWAAVALQGGSATTGDWKWRPTDEDLPGWVKANGSTIGNGSSGGTLLASAQAAALFGWFWRKFSNTQCPVLPGGRGASSAADFAANKTIAVLSLRGTGIVGMDTMAGGATTNLSGVPVTNGSATAAGSLLGENLHPLVAAENAAHAHGVTDPTHNHSLSGSLINVGGATAAVGAIPFGGATIAAAATGISVNSSGSGTAHNTVQLSVTGSMYWKL